MQHWLAFYGGFTMFCPHCGIQSAPSSTFCSACGAGLAFDAPVTRSRLVRPRQPRMLAGVCSGIAIHFGWDINMVRIVFAIITCLTTGCAILFYLAAWIILPNAPYALRAPSPDQNYPV
jgi:phage shock protein C